MSVSSTLSARLEALVHRWAGPGPIQIEPMPGGASTRQFFRVRRQDNRTAVAMHVPDANQSDEIVKSAEQPRRWPFLEIRDLLAERGIRVPELLAQSCEEGLILIEDLGDDTLANYLLHAPHQRQSLYQAAVRGLARAQSRLAELPPDCIVRSRAFDEDLLRWELDHFRQWGLQGRGRQLDAEQRSRYDAACDQLARRLASWPRGFVHRDYQSRNLMVRLEDGQPQLVWIDFQDALLGPRVYDLVALLSDSYQTFERDFIEARLDDYADELGLDAAERAAVGREFDVVTVQRKLKDAGRFVYIDRVKGNPNFVKFFEPTVAKARAALQRQHDDPQLTELARLLDEWFDSAGG